MGCGESKSSIISALTSQLNHINTQKTKIQQNIEEVHAENKRREEIRNQNLIQLKQEKEEAILDKKLLEQRLKELDPKLEEARSQVHSAKQKKKNLKSEVNKLKADFENAVSQKKGQQEQQLKIEEEVKALNEKVKGLEEEIKGYHNIETIQDEINYEIQSIIDLAREKEDLIQDLTQKIQDKQAENEKKAEIRNEIKRRTGDSSALANNLVHLKSDIQTSEKTQAELLESQSLIENLDQKIKNFLITDEEKVLENDLSLNILTSLRTIQEVTESNVTRLNIAQKIQALFDINLQIETKKSATSLETSSLISEIEKALEEKETARIAKLNARISKLDKKINKNDERYTKELQVLLDRTSKVKLKIQPLQEQLEKLQSVPSTPETAATEETAVVTENPNEPEESQNLNIIATPVKYGIPVKIRHAETNVLLHSHPVNYTSGSNQQEVSCHHSEYQNNWFIPKGPTTKDNRWACKISTQIKNGDIIRLEHLVTRKNLHVAPDALSTSSGLLEVSSFGLGGVGDVDDDWKVEILNKAEGEAWISTDAFRLINVSTNAALHSSKGHQTETGQQEVTASADQDINSVWIVHEIA